MKLKTWQTGALIGFGVGIAVGMWENSCRGESCFLIQFFPPVLGTISFLFAALMSEFVPMNTAIFIIFFAIPYSIVGALIGLWIDKKLQKRKK